MTILARPVCSYDIAMATSNIMATWLTSKFSQGTDEHLLKVSAFAFFHDPIILVYPPKFLHKHCFQFLLGRLYVSLNPKRN